MKRLEINIPAKLVQDKRRRNDMAKWRKQKQLSFASLLNMQQWFDYTKWHKRPHTVYVKLGLIQVTFTDNMKGAK